MAVLKNGLRVQCASKSEGQFIAEEIFEEGVYCSHGVTNEINHHKSGQNMHEPFEAHGGV